MKVAVVDYGAGNVVSVIKALEHVGVDAALTADPSAILAADGVMFPGQGHFGQAMKRLRASGLDKTLDSAIRSGKPFLGVCLGLQLLFEGSDEAPGVDGLSVFKGRCERFGGDVKVPQIGWNAIDVQQPGVFGALDHGRHFYFVHSFHAVPDDPSVLAATATHGAPFCAAVARDNVMATQFHPEKSGRAGLDLLRRFVADAAGDR